MFLFNTVYQYVFPLKVLQPCLLDTIERSDIDDQKISSPHRMPKDLIKKILVYYLDDPAINPLNFMLVNRKWYVLAMSHPFLRLANIIEKLRNDYEWRESDRVNFDGLMELQSEKLSRSQFQRLKKIKRFDIGFNRLVYSQGFVCKEYYRPLLDQIKWKLKDVTNLPLDPKLKKLIRDTHSTINQFLPIPTEEENINFWESVIKQQCWSNVCVGAQTPEIRSLTEEIRLKILDICKIHGKQITDIGFALQLVTLNEKALMHLNPSLKNNETVILQALKQDCGVIKYVDENLQRNLSFVLKALSENSGVFESLNDNIRENKDFVLAIAKHENEKIMNDSSLILSFCKTTTEVLAYVNPLFLKNRAWMLKAIKNDPTAFNHACPELKSDKLFLIEAVQANGSVLYHIEKNFLCNQDFLLACSKFTSKAIELADLALRADYQFMLKAAEVNFESLAFADQKLKSDLKFISDALKINIKAILHADDNIRSDSEFLLETIKENFIVFKYLDDKFKKDINFVQKAAAINGAMLQWVDANLATNPIVLSTVNKSAEYELWLEEQELQRKRDRFKREEKSSSANHGSSYRRFAMINGEIPVYTQTENGRITKQIFMSGPYK